MRSKSNLYNLAKMAKDRLKKNTYDKGGMSISHTSVSAFEKYIQQNKTMEKKHTEKKIVVNSYEEELYKKVCEILSSGKGLQNPVVELMDKGMFKNLDTEGKQHYINTLNAKYKALKDRYYKEHYSSYLAL